MEISVRYKSLALQNWCSHLARQGSNALNRSMQGLWSAHRRAKVNLNLPPSPGPSTLPSAMLPQESVPAEPAPPEPTAVDEQTMQVTNEASSSLTTGNSSAANGKRKSRPTRIPEEGNKRAKLSSLSKDYAPPSTRPSDIGGADTSIDMMRELVIMPLKHPEVYLHIGVQPARGILLHGPPGCGKTLLANAIAGVSASIIYYLIVLTIVPGSRRSVHKYFCAFDSVGNVGRVGKNLA